MALSVSIKKKLSGFTLDVSFETKGKRLGILGASGSGKSMTMRCIAGIEEADEGRILLNDRPLLDTSNKIALAPQKRNVGYLFQNYALFPNMSVEKNIACGLKLKDKTAKEEIVRSMINRFALEGLEKRMPSELSGGQQQRVALARIMAYEPDVIMLDEPFSAMDSYLKDVLQAQLLEILDDYQGDVIMVSHDRDEIYKICDEMMIMDEGKVVEIGKTQDLFKHPRHMRTAVLSGCKNVSAVEVIDAHHIRVIDWDLTLYSQQEVSDRIAYVGLRAHDFIPRWKDKPEKNAVVFDLRTIAKLPFETHYYVNCAQSQLCWFIQREDENRMKELGMPDYLEFPADKLLLLEE